MLDFTPGALVEAVPPIPTHAYAAFAATGIGAVQFARPKGTKAHRVMGWAFVLLMAYVAVTGLFISTINTWGYFSPIHVLVPVTLATLALGVARARQGAVTRHARAMTTLFVLAIVVTGLFTFWPGRIMHEVLFGPGGTG